MMPALRSLSILCVGLLAITHSLGVGAAELDGGAQQRIRAATFEVVQLKPSEGSVVYEKPLPMELLPYQERNDKYRSVGTAFAIGGNRYVTAGHVLLLGQGSQFGAPALRDAAGNVYPVDQILKYSGHEDFAVFSLRTEPKGIRPLSVADHPRLNDPVFAVGNALGEGIVIRDGLYTSDTPEELNGEWKWLRFSAAASPGNSGGPLVDERGRVVGVVLRKTQAENLNYALPIERVVKFPDRLAKLDARSPIRLPIMDATETAELHEQFALPLRPPDFYQTALRISQKFVEAAQARLIEHNQDKIFPNGSGSNEVLHRVISSPLPRFLHEKQDGIWQVLEQGQAQQLQLDHNGFVRMEGGMIRLRAPDDVPLAKLYGDSKLLMDLFLKVSPLRRQVGSDSVKVVSLGAAQDLGDFTDHYGRVWQVRSWLVPYADLVMVALCLPSPEGYDLLLAPIQTGFQSLAVDQQELMTTYLYVSLTGSLERWREYLEQKGAQPHLFDGLKIDIDIDADAHVRFESRRCRLEVTPELIKLSKDSVLTLQTSFFRDKEVVVWDVAGALVYEDAHRPNRVEFVRLSTPEPSLPENFQSTWKKLQTRDYPFNSMLINENGDTRIRTAATSGADANVRYALTVVGEGAQPLDAMTHKLDLLQHSFKSLE
jgi:S1-C subfamily serine protease